MIELKCPNCRADIELDDSREIGFCRYCGTQILIEPNQSKVDGIAGVENLLLRAEQFLKENNIEKAMEYFNKVLDVDINNEVARNAIARLKTPISLKDKLEQRKIVAKPRETENEVKTEIGLTAAIIMSGIRRYLDRLSEDFVRKGSINGYYCVGGYETEPIIDNSGSLFFISDDFGVQKENIIKENHGRQFINRDGTLMIMSRNEMTWLIDKLNSELKNDGFCNSIVRMENAGAHDITCGFKNNPWTGRKRIYTQMPAYRIYFKINW